MSTADEGQRISGLAQAYAQHTPGIRGKELTTDAAELRARFEALASDPSYQFARSRKGTYVNGAVAPRLEVVSAGRQGHREHTMTRPTRLDLLEYAREGLVTLIGTGSGYEHEDILAEYEQHLEWVKTEIERRKALEAANT